MSLFENDLSSAFEFVIGSLPQLIERERSKPDEIGNCRTGQATWKKRQLPPAKFSRACTASCSPAVIGGWRLRTSLATPSAPEQLCRG